MGTAFSLGVIAEKREVAEDWLQMGVNEIKRIECLLSEFLPDSATSMINNNAADHPVHIERECFNLIQRCIDISILTKGDFDITVSQFKKLYQFKKSHFQLPDSETIKKTMKNSGYQKIEMNPLTTAISFNKKDLKISFSAIGKGYASDRVKNLWKENGVGSGFINASGDLNAFGKKPDGLPWRIGIADPDKKSGLLLYVPLHNASVATSGDYEQYFIWKGEKYSHNINPKTGLPVTGIKSVTVFSPSAELSDALATAVYVKGVGKGLEFVNQLPYTHCIIIDNKNKIYFSKKLNYEKVAC